MTRRKGSDLTETSGKRGRGRPASGRPPLRHVHFRADEDLYRWLESRRVRTLLGGALDDGTPEATSADLQARRDLVLHRQLIAASLAEVPGFTLDELDVLAFIAGEQVSMALRAVEPDTGETAPVLWREVIDGVSVGLVPGDAVDFAALLGKLRPLTAAQDHALRDALSRAIAADSAAGPMPDGWTEEQARQVATRTFTGAGLRVTETAE